MSLSRLYSAATPPFPDSPFSRCARALGPSASPSHCSTLARSLARLLARLAHARIAARFRRLSSSRRARKNRLAALCIRSAALLLLASVGASLAILKRGRALPLLAP